MWGFRKIEPSLSFCFDRDGEPPERPADSDRLQDRFVQQVVGGCLEAVLRCGLHLVSLKIPETAD